MLGLDSFLFCRGDSRIAPTSIGLDNFLKKFITFCRGGFETLPLHDFLRPIPFEPKIIVFKGFGFQLKLGIHVLQKTIIGVAFTQKLL